MAITIQRDCPGAGCTCKSFTFHTDPNIFGTKDFWSCDKCGLIDFNISAPSEDASTLAHLKPEECICFGPPVGDCAIHGE